MTTAHRLEKVEASLTTTQLVVRWLADAHRFGDMGTYMRWLAEATPGDFPMNRLTREAKESAAIRTRGASRADVDRAVRRLLIDAAFRVLLVIAINVRTQDFIDREGLVHAALATRLALILSAPDELGGDPLRHLAVCRDLFLLRVTELHALETARSRVEARYLDGAEADFPAARQAWAEQRRKSETSAVLASRLSELDGAEPPPADDPAAFEARVNTLMADLVEPSKAKTYDELGDGWKAHNIAVAWLRSSVLG